MLVGEKLQKGFTNKYSENNTEIDLVLNIQIPCQIESSEIYGNNEKIFFSWKQKQPSKIDL